MAYTRLPSATANATWQGATVYARPAHDSANASFAPADAPVEGVLLIATTPPVPAVTLTAAGTVTAWVDGSARIETIAPTPPATVGTLARLVFEGAGIVSTAPPTPTATVSALAHRFEDYVTPPLVLTLACRFYVPRPLTCPVYLDTWQPPCLSVLEGAVIIETLSPISAAIISGRGHGVQLAGGLIAAAPTPIPVALLTATAEQDLALIENGAAGVRASHVNGTQATATRAPARHANGRRTTNRAQAPQQQAASAATGPRIPQTHTLPMRVAALLDHTNAIRLPPSAAGIPHTETLRQREPLHPAHTQAIRYSAGTRTPYAERIRTRNRREVAQQQGLKAAPRTLLFRARHGHDTSNTLAVDYQQMMWPLPGRWWPWYEPPSLDVVFYCNSEYIARPLSCLVALCSDTQPYCPGVDPDPTATIVIPIRRLYRVINTVTLTRVSDGAEIPADGLSLSLDTESWSWSWSARVPGSALALIRVDGLPVDLLATINGQPIRLLIDSIGRSREFGSSWLAIRGRGHAAVLASPTAPSLNRYNTETHTAQQLLIDALTDNGISIGWAVDWGLEDWEVPPGAWSHTGSYIDAATRIAEAGGGYVQGHDTTQTLIVRPYYPTAPWEWGEATPDIAMPEDVCRTEGVEWVEKSGYNAVWITGGRRDYIRRTGTDGLTMAPTVVDALATDAIMTRQRGIRILGDTGRQALITVKLPVITETGIIRPGNLIEYTEQGVTRRGLSRSVAVECGFPEVWQTIKIEAREGAA